ncbi:hypothetical protein PAECIP112173_00379 [Paenibacillus sp. JJ-100]|nr:hypothetical protein PAECIP112173_00379 [Paenibacillus sp. JJ-100]
MKDGKPVQLDLFSSLTEPKGPPPAPVLNGMYYEKPLTNLYPTCWGNVITKNLPGGANTPRLGRNELRGSGAYEIHQL